MAGQFNATVGRKGTDPVSGIESVKLWRYTVRKKVEPGIAIRGAASPAHHASCVWPAFCAADSSHHAWVRPQMLACEQRTRFVQKVSNPVQYLLQLKLQTFKVKYSVDRCNHISARLDMHLA
jgi:hypothetical protein